MNKIGVTNKVDWPAFLGRHDLVWERAPDSWLEAPFLGNGTLGTMIYRSGPKTLRLEVGRGDVYDHREVDFGLWLHRCRLPIGYLTLETTGAIRSFTGRLDLWNAEYNGQVTTDKGAIRLRAIVHATRMVLQFDVEPSECERDCRFTWHPEPAVAPGRTSVLESWEKMTPGERENAPDYIKWIMAPGYVAHPPFQPGNEGAIQFCYQPLRDGSKPSGETTTAWQEREVGKAKRQLWLTVSHTFPETNSTPTALATLTAALAADETSLLREHRDWWNAYYPASFLSIPDGYWEGFYWIQMYKLACATRVDGPCIDQMGPWYQSTTWPCVWWNLNVQLTYSPVGDANRLEMGESLVGRLDRHRDNLVANMRNSSRGWGIFVSFEIPENRSQARSETKPSAWPNERVSRLTTDGWKVSRLMPPGNILAAAYLGLEQDGGWEEVPAALPSPGFFISVHDMRGPCGIVYLARKVQVAEAGDLILHVGHDGGARVFLDGEAIGGAAGAVNPAPLTRTSARVTLAAGEHEIVVALDRAGFTDCAGIGGTSGQDFRSQWGQGCMGHLPWAMHNYWMILRRSMDEPRMRDKFFPLLRQTINTHLQLITKGDDGRWHLPNSSSPEYPGWVPDTNYDLALLRWGCQTLVELCARFNIDDPLLPKWKDVLANLTEYPADANGFMVGAGLPFAMAHRHWSHLLAIYPLYLVNVDQPEARTLIAKSLRHFMSFEPTKGGDRTPYTWAAASSMASALGAGDLALQYLNGTKQKLVGQDGFQGVSQNTTMYSECNNPCMETPLFMAQSIHEMLIQSWGGTIRIFPACPSGWKDAAFDNLRAEGAFLVSAVRREGKTEWVRITSLAGEPCRVNVEGQTRELKLAKGETIIIHPGPRKMAPVIAPVAITESNCFGKRD